MKEFTIKPIATIKSDFPDGSALGFDFSEKINSAGKSGVKKTDYVLENSSLK